MDHKVIWRVNKSNGDDDNDEENEDGGKKRIGFKQLH